MNNFKVVLLKYKEYFQKKNIFSANPKLNKNHFFKDKK